MPFAFDAADAIYREPILKVKTTLHRFAFRAEAEAARKEDARLAEAAIDGDASVSIVFPWDQGWAYLVEYHDEKNL